MVKPLDIISIGLIIIVLKFQGVRDGGQVGEKVASDSGSGALEMVSSQGCLRAFSKAQQISEAGQGQAWGNLLGLMGAQEMRVGG